jgi:hypothetical protein
MTNLFASPLRLLFFAFKFELAVRVCSKQLIKLHI